MSQSSFYASTSRPSSTLEESIPLQGSTTFHTIENTFEFNSGDNIITGRYRVTPVISELQNQIEPVTDNQKNSLYLLARITAQIHYLEWFHAEHRRHLEIAETRSPYSTLNRNLRNIIKPFPILTSLFGAAMSALCCSLPGALFNLPILHYGTAGSSIMICCGTSYWFGHDYLYLWEITLTLERSSTDSGILTSSAEAFYINILPSLDRQTLHSRIEATSSSIYITFQRYLPTNIESFHEVMTYMGINSDNNNFSNILLQRITPDGPEHVPLQQESSNDDVSLITITRRQPSSSETPITASSETEEQELDEFSQETTSLCHSESQEYETAFSQ